MFSLSRMLFSGIISSPELFLIDDMFSKQQKLVSVRILTKIHLQEIRTMDNVLTDSSSFVCFLCKVIEVLCHFIMSQQNRHCEKVVNYCISNY